MQENQDNEHFGIKNNGTQYKTCVKCTERKHKKPEYKKEEITCCGEEDIRNTFKQVICKIVHLNEL